MRQLAESQQNVSGRSSLESRSCYSEKIEVWFNQRKRGKNRFSLGVREVTLGMFGFSPQFQIRVNSFQTSLGMKALMMSLISAHKILLFSAEVLRKILW